MKIDSATASKYFYLEDYLRTEFPKVLQKQQIMNAFWKWSDFSDSIYFRQFFYFGTAPLVRVYGDNPLGCTYAHQEGEHRSGPIVGMRWGITWSDKAINIYSGLAALASDQFPKAQPSVRTSQQRQLFDLLECTLLHEMIHWSYYYRNNAEEKQAGYNGDLEYGTSRFEVEAYGRSMDIDWHLLCFEPETIPALFGVAIKPGKYACIVDEVLKWSPAYYAGVLANDQIVKFDGHTIGNEQDFDTWKDKKVPGDRATVEVNRNGKIVSLSVTYPDEKSADARKRYGFK